MGLKVKETLCAMSVAVKICGITSFEIYQHCADKSVDWVGFVFFEKSPRHLSVEAACALIREVEEKIAPEKRPKHVALTVDASDDELTTLIEHTRPDMIQLHGNESPERVAEIKNKFNIATMPVIKIAGCQDVKKAKLYEDNADWLLFDALPKKQAHKETLPGGRGKAFDWHLLQNCTINRPWMLAGGLNAQNVGEALAISHAPCADISSGVEDRPGIKSLDAISSFMHAVKQPIDYPSQR